MPSQTGFVDNSNGLAHYAMLDVIRTVCIAAGWAVLRYDTSSENRELILRAPGLSGGEEIYLGIRTYQNAAADYYNLAAAGFVGYVPSNSFDSQPGAMLSGVPAHNNRIDYWLTVNGQRLVLAMKVGTPVYESMYLGKMLPYARPSQYPYPVVCAGMLNGIPATRFSDTSHTMSFKGGGTDANTTSPNLCLRFNDGQWLRPKAWPWSNNTLCGVSDSGARQLRDTGGNYPLLPVVLHDATRGILGELDGVYHISGFNNAVENTITLDGKQHVVIQDVARTGFADYFAMRMD